MKALVSKKSSYYYILESIVIPYLSSNKKNKSELPP